MEIRTTLKEFSENIKYYQFPTETYLRIFIDTDINSKVHTDKNQSLPFITSEKQRHFLNLIPSEYCSSASEELVRIIEQSHINTDMINLVANDKHMRNLPNSFAYENWSAT